MISQQTSQTNNIANTANGGIMNQAKTSKLYRYALMMALGALPMAAVADVSVSVTGFVRQETGNAFGDANPYNQGYGNPFNGTTVVNSFGNEIVRQQPTREPNWNLLATRGELDFKVRFNNNWEGFAKIRGFFDWRLDDEFEDVDHFDSGFDGGIGSTLETNAEDYMIDLPSLYLDYNNGPLWLRIGNQQIAWGEAIFFRVFDVVNGLDLRRHSFLDVAAEEYSDKRVPSLGIRGSYRFQNDWEFEGFVQHFRPSVLSPLNTPYNFVASQFVVQQKQGWEDSDGEFNFGARLSGQAGDFDLSFMAVSRMGPDGVFRWTESGVNPFVGLPGLEPVGQLISQTAFELNPGGIWTADEWFHYAGLSRLDGVGGLSASVLEFPSAQALGAFPISPETCAAVGLASNLRACASLELDVFFDPNEPTGNGGLGPLKGHIAREYFREEIFGAGMTYVFQGEPNSLFDQLVLRIEATLALGRKFTNLTLSRDYIEEDEFVSNVSFEKYHRFSQAFPSTYFVLQWMHKSESDMLGRHVSGFDNDGVPKGENSFNALAFALQQPFPGLIWRADLAVLYDTNGGVLIQPGVRWRPRDDVQLDIYANVIDSDGGNDDVMQTFEEMDEVFVRFTYYF